jgi:hypothetical protein
MKAPSQPTNTSAFWNTVPAASVNNQWPAEEDWPATHPERSGQKGFACDLSPVTRPLAPVTFPHYSRHFQKWERGKPYEGNGFCYSW